MKIRLALKALFFFVGTFLHESAHYAAALLFGKPVSFSVVPKISGDSIVYGDVSAKVRYKVFSAFIAAAPLVWWLVALILLKRLPVTTTGIVKPGAYVHSYLEKLRHSPLSAIAFLWLLLQLLWAGRLSLKDARTCVSGLFSVSGMLAISTAVGVWYLAGLMNHGIF